MQGFSVPEMLILGVAISFLAYAFTGSARLVGVSLFATAMGVVAVGLVTKAPDRDDRGARRRAAELAPRSSDPSRRLARGGETTNTGLFGVETNAHSFVYLVDISPSMAEGVDESPLNRLRTELKRSVNALAPGSQFQIVGYDRIPRSFVGGPKCRLVQATDRTVNEAFKAIDAMAPSRGPDLEDVRWLRAALHTAMGMEPQVIYFVTDAQGPELLSHELGLIEKWNRGGASIHVIQLQTEGHETRWKWLAKLGRHNAGSFRQVSLGADQRSGQAQEGPGERPPWVTESKSSARHHNGDSYRVVVSTGPCTTEARARDAMDEVLVKATIKYIDLELGEGRGKRVVDLNYIWDTIVQEPTYTEIEPSGDEVIGDMRRMYARLEFNNEVKEHFRNRWHQHVRYGWLAATGLLLSFIATVFTYLKMDTATRGYYTGRLKFAVVLVMLVLLGLAAALATQYGLVG